jgi:hypothetical protein
MSPSRLRDNSGYILMPSAAAQVNGNISPLPSLTINTLGIRVSPGSLTASATGTVSGMPVNVHLSSTATAGNSSYRLGAIRVTTSSGALDALLASQSSQVSQDLGFSVPAGSASETTRSSAELVFDTAYGVRLLNVSLAPGSRVGLSDLARRIGFGWQGSSSDGLEAIAFTGPQLHYVPNKPGAPALVWSDQALKGGELGVTALVDIPPLGITGMRAKLLVQHGGRLSAQVSAPVLALLCPNCTCQPSRNGSLASTCLAASEDGCTTTAELWQGQVCRHG